MLVSARCWRHHPGVEDIRQYSLPVVLTPGEDGWIVATCPALQGCISQGRTREEALANIQEAIDLCLEAGDRPAEVFRALLD